MAVTWTEPTATDNSGTQPSFTQSHQSGDIFIVGTTQVRYIFSDVSGNQAVCTFTVTIGNWIIVFNYSYIIFFVSGDIFFKF